MYHSKTPQGIKDNIMVFFLWFTVSQWKYSSGSSAGLVAWELDLTYATSKGLLFLVCHRTWNLTFKQLEGVKGMVLMFCPCFPVHTICVTVIPR